MAKRRSIAGAILVAMTFCLVLVPLAAGARAPTLKEREAITKALPRFVRDTPVECIWLNTRVANGSSYAIVRPAYLNATASGSRCTRYATNGFYVLRKSTSWKVVYRGSDPPPCSLKVPRDLIGCLPP